MSKNVIKLILEDCINKIISDLKFLFLKKKEFPKIVYAKYQNVYHRENAGG